MSDILTQSDPVIGYEAITVSGHRPPNPLMEMSVALWKKMDAAWETYNAELKRGKINDEVWLAKVTHLDLYRKTSAHIMDIVFYGYDCTCRPNDAEPCWTCTQINTGKRLMEEEV